MSARTVPLDKECRKVDFFNTTFIGQGCAGEYCDTQEPYDSNICYIDCIPCKAEEHRFGGCGGGGVGNQFLVLKQLNLFSKTFLQSVFV